jgi:hypothetical protein
MYYSSRVFVFLVSETTDGVKILERNYDSNYPILILYKPLLFAQTTPPTCVRNGKSKIFQLVPPYFKKIHEVSYFF